MHTLTIKALTAAVCLLSLKCFMRKFILMINTASLCLFRVQTICGLLIHKLQPGLIHDSITKRRCSPPWHAHQEWGGHPFGLAAEHD